MIRTAIQDLVDNLEQFALFPAGEHALDDRRKYANRFVYFALLQINTSNRQKLRIVRTVMLHQQRRCMLGAFRIFRFQIRAREHRDELVVFFVGFDNALEHFGCLVRSATRDVSFQHAAQCIAIVAHQLQRFVISVERFVLRRDLMQTIGCLNERSRGFAAHVLFHITVSKF